MATKKSATKSGAKKGARKGAAKKSAARKGATKKSGARKAGISLPGIPNFACISSCILQYRQCVKTATDKVSCQKKLIACIDKCLLKFN